MCSHDLAVVLSVRWGWLVLLCGVHDGFGLDKCGRDVLWLCVRGGCLWLTLRCCCMIPVFGYVQGFKGCVL